MLGLCHGVGTCHLYISLPRRRSYGFVTQSFLSHERVRGVGTRDEPLRTFAGEAIFRYIQLKALFRENVRSCKLCSVDERIQK